MALHSRSCKGLQAAHEVGADGPAEAEQATLLHSGGRDGLQAVHEVRVDGPAEAEQADHVLWGADLPHQLPGRASSNFQLQLRIL